MSNLHLVCHHRHQTPLFPLHLLNTLLYHPQHPLHQHHWKRTSSKWAWILWLHSTCHYVLMLQNCHPWTYPVSASDKGALNSASSILWKHRVCRGYTPKVFFIEADVTHYVPFFRFLITIFSGGFKCEIYSPVPGRCRRKSCFTKKESKAAIFILS